jgi:hypothetical protein
MEDRVFGAAVTVSVAWAVTPLIAAEIVAEPAATALARPDAFTVATDVLEELHVALALTLPVLPSL